MSAQKEAARIAFSQFTRVIMWASAVFIAGTTVGHARQSPSDLAFEVATVRRTDPNSRAGIDMRTFPGGRLKATNCTLKLLIMGAYGVAAHQISGGPSWLDAERFDITAIAEADAGRDQDRV